MKKKIYYNNKLQIKLVGEKDLDLGLKKINHQKEKIVLLKLVIFIMMLKNLLMCLLFNPLHKVDYKYLLKKKEKKCLENGIK